VIRGRVVDTKGQAVAGARVRLDEEPASERPGRPPEPGKPPFLATTDAAGGYEFAEATHPGLEETIRGLELFARHTRGRQGSTDRGFVLRATHGERASWIEVVDREGEPLRVPDLVVERGAVARVVVKWTDGAPAAGVALWVMLEDRELSKRNERIASLSICGVTDARGECVLGVVPDRKFRVMVTAAHRDGQPGTETWTARPRACWTLTLKRGRTVRGRLLTAEGKPAVGYRVAPLLRPVGDERVATTDAAGRFELGGVEAGGEGVAVFDRLPPPGPSLEAFAAHAARLLGGPLLIRCPVEDDAGDMTLPELGTFEVRLEDSRGGRPRSARAMWRHAGRFHGGRYAPADAEGVVRFERLPFGIALDLDVTIDDERHGEIEQRFALGVVTGEPRTLRVTGAGTVVLRFRPAGAPAQPLALRHVRADWSDHPGLGYADGPVSELRGWVRPGVCAKLRVRADGHRPRVLRNVEVRADAPTFLDVELEPA
jgi:hypothetical protein